MQTFVAYFIVAIALIYAAWLFMPNAARRWLISRLAMVASASQRVRLARLQASAENAGCSTCKGCETDAKPTSTVRPIRLHRQ